MAHHGGELQLSAVLGHSHFSSALEGFEGQEYVGHTPSLILKVDTLWLTGFACKRLSHLGQQLAWPLVETHYGSVRIVGLLVKVQDLFHPPHELLGVVLGWDHPLLDQMRLEFVFLSVLPTSHARPSPRCPAPLLCPPAASKTSDCALVEVRSRPQGDQVRFGTPLQRTLVEPIGLRAFKRGPESSLVEAFARPLDCGNGGLQSIRAICRS